MGALSLKPDRVAHENTGVIAEEVIDAREDSGSNDSLSDTRPLPQSYNTNSFSDTDHQFGHE